VFTGRLFREGSLHSKLLLWLDYSYRAIYTLASLARQRPRVVFAQCPPSFCPMTCWLYCAATGARLVVDGHNAAFEPPWIRVPGHFFVLRRASAVLVHNLELFRCVKERFPGITFRLLPTPLMPQPQAAPERPSAGARYLLVVVSFAPDEPLEQVLEGIAAYLSRSPDAPRVKVTGNYLKAPAIRRKFVAVPGLEFLGYVDKAAYYDLLRNAWGVLGFSTRLMVQQGACVEAVAAGVPMVLSESETNRRLCANSALFAKPEPAAVAEALERFERDRDNLARAAWLDKAAWERDWQHCYAELCASLRLPPA
jgi:glycosyltransferase involved in cell wall biosynthesis